MIAAKNMLRRFCKDFTEIENYNKAVSDTAKKWDCHHRYETHDSEGHERGCELSMKELDSLGMYFDRPPSDFIFIPHKEHISLHGRVRRKHWCPPSPKGRVVSEETRRRISESNKGKSRTSGKEHYMYGKHQEKDVLDKISNTKKQRHDRWWTDGNNSVFGPICPEGYRAGRVIHRGAGNAKRKAAYERYKKLKHCTNRFSVYSLYVYKGDLYIGTFSKNLLIAELNKIEPLVQATKKGFDKAFYKNKDTSTFYYKGLKFIKEIRCRTI